MLKWDQIPQSAKLHLQIMKERSHHWIIITLICMGLCALAFICYMGVCLQVCV